MAQPLREIKNRIRSISNVSKITHAMEMVSIAKLRPTKNQLIISKQYYLKIEELLKNLFSNNIGIAHPFIVERKTKNKRALCLLTSDTGLCGSYNHRIIRLAEDFIGKYGKEETILVTVGRKGFNYFKRKGINIMMSYTSLNGRYSDKIAGEILMTLTDIFLSQNVDEVYVAYTYFESVSRHIPMIEKILNIDSSTVDRIDYIFEPDINAILEEFVPLYLFNKFKLFILNAFTAEHSARSIAMKESTENAKELLEGLLLVRNKVRQADITREMMEIASSVEVMR